jgi:hypothetical protein
MVKIREVWVIPCLLIICEDALIVVVKQELDTLRVELTQTASVNTADI